MNLRHDELTARCVSILLTTQNLLRHAYYVPCYNSNYTIG
ncbi:hypothetical protein VPHF99_0302 [Vibrio phage F99]